MISESALIARLVLSTIFGSLIGVEREIQDKPAGIRTHAIVCIGACLFTIASIEFSGGIAGGLVDPSRVAAGIVTGIGFLGAGAIFRSKDRVEGLTTAADLWLVAAVGLAVGIGYYFAAFFSTIIALFILYSGTLWKRRQERKKKGKRNNPGSGIAPNHFSR